MSKAMMKRLGKMIYDKYYDLPERYAPELLDLGYVEYIRECQIISLGITTMSFYQITPLGIQAYKEWSND
jgi:S-adenosylmethionine/arginine decarboxylase-like enzyme